MDKLICDCPLCYGFYYTKDLLKKSTFNILKKIDTKEKYRIK